jgi:threonine synthase
MKSFEITGKDLYRFIDTSYAPESSIVLRYRNILKSGYYDKEEYREYLKQTSIREGARILYILNYKGVDVYILDETSLMHTKTLKSIDGCVSIAKCLAEGSREVVFESGGNTGTALTEYGQKAGIETFFFIPERNINLLKSKVFESQRAHLIGVEKAEIVKRAALLFAKLNGFRHIPEISWRYEASMFRGLFILEYMMENKGFDWITQTISAAFGPIGIYRVLLNLGKGIKKIPRFLGVQQENNCPMYRAWKNKEVSLKESPSESGELLTDVMYDVKPYTYGTYNELETILVRTGGDITTVNHREFKELLEKNFEGKGILELFSKKGIDITIRNNEVVEKTGLIALAGTLKEIDRGTIEKGSRVICCLTSGISEADGKAEAEFRVSNLSDVYTISKEIRQRAGKL